MSYAWVKRRSSVLHLERAKQSNKVHRGQLRNEKRIQRKESALLSEGSSTTVEESALMRQ